MAYFAIIAKFRPSEQTTWLGQRPDGTLFPRLDAVRSPFQRMETDMNVSAMNDNEKIEAMAAAMRRFGEGCTREQLNLYFPNADIDRLHEQARMKANDDALL
ncbi:hypothetical protein BA725_15565, partial [Agrobacterium pusense]